MKNSYSRFVIILHNLKFKCYIYCRCKHQRPNWWNSRNRSHVSMLWWIHRGGRHSFERGRFHRIRRFHAIDGGCPRGTSRACPFLVGKRRSCSRSNPNRRHCLDVCLWKWTYRRRRLVIAIWGGFGARIRRRQDATDESLSGWSSVYCTVSDF